MNTYLFKLLQDPSIPVGFDYDGVLFEARWYEHRISMPDFTVERMIEGYKRGEGLETKPIPYMMNFVSSLPNPKFIVTHTQSEVEDEFKKQQVARYYPSIPREMVITACSAEDKIVHLQKIYEEYGCFIFVDDYLNALFRYEANFDDQYCHFFHSSSLFV